MIPYVNIHTHISDNDSGCIIADRVLPCGGVHPWSAMDSDVDLRIEKLWSENICAIGEIGLDYSRPIDRELQKDVFTRQLEVAQTRELPVVIHCVRAYDETLNILSGFDLKAVIFHGFIGSKETVVKASKKDYYISIGEVSLNSDKTIDAMKSTSPQRLFIETDTGKESIEQLYIKISDLLNIDNEQLKEQIYDNYKKIFG